LVSRTARSESADGAATMAFDHSWKVSRMSSGTPRISPMTITGSGMATSVAKSNSGPSASASSIRSTAISSMRSRSVFLSVPDVK